ncbi:hypothetical protein QYE76_053179 [Lolium multiflorum]|uniref:Bidirectional sugar transporter SWEET n=1 Tax=Lolium multiflorum TaxID=4521 RepID=A0AAD8WMA0_LOLMU|nr:hypothetical protein QYE76_053179 [Lolium multiflorum]
MAPLGLAGASSYHELCCYGAGIAGNIFAFVLFVSPLPTFRRIVRNRSTEQFSAMPYIYSLLNCLICVWYALPFVSYGVVLVATVNTIGAAFQLAYTAVFIAYADAKKRLKVSMLLLGVFCAFGLIVYVSMTMFDHKPRQTFVGYLSVASLICMFASPLSIINLVIKTKSVEYMPFYLSLSMSLMSVSFFAYGVLLDDFFIYMDGSYGLYSHRCKPACSCCHQNSEEKHDLSLVISICGSLGQGSLSLSRSRSRFSQFAEVQVEVL